MIPTPVIRRFSKVNRMTHVLLLILSQMLDNRSECLIFDCMFQRFMSDNFYPDKMKWTIHGLNVYDNKEIL